MPVHEPTLAGYVRDVDYPAHFHRETMPLYLGAALTALGRRAPDLAQPYAWLDLGCGSGLGVVVAAATNPRGRFIGIDADARAIARAQALAASVGLENAQFHCCSFEEAAGLPADALPPCAFIVSHGVYSWVGPAARAALQRIVAQRLAPGGVLYLAYLSQPGGAAFAAAQRYMHLAAARLQGGSADKAEAACRLLRGLAEGGAGYFREHPAAQAELAQAAQCTGGYLAHEYLNAHRDALHASEVMAAFAGLGCDFAGSATLLENIDAVSVPGGLQPALQQLRAAGASAAEIETFKDIARNQKLRRDVYQRRDPQRSVLLAPGEHRAALLAQKVCLLPAAPAAPLAGQGELVFETPIGPTRLAAAHAAPLVDALHGGPRSYAQLAALPAYQRRPGFVNQLLQMLAWAGWLHPVHAQDPGPAPASALLQQQLEAGWAPAAGPLLAARAIGSACAAPAVRDRVREARNGLC